MSILLVKLRSPNGQGVLPQWTPFEADVPDGPPPGPPPDPPYWLTPGYIQGQLLADVYARYVDAFGRQCVPGPPGSGAVDIDYYTTQILDSGGWVNPTPDGRNQIGYWSDKIGTDLRAHGYRLK